MNVTILLLVMVWVLSGLLVAFFMKVTDENKGNDYSGSYWIKNRDLLFFRVFLLVVSGPISLLIGIFVIWDYCLS